jgi:hypothetical protein
MTDLFADERIQFFLRNRDDIKIWAAIESDVMAATRELLARARPALEERIASVDSQAVTSRYDNGQWERILVRHEHWPSTVGLALEWNRSVDPRGANCPKTGVFWWADPPTLIAPRTQLVSLVPTAKLQALGYKVPLEGVWPVGARVSAKPDWWRDPEAWVNGIVENLANVWPLLAPHIDDALKAAAIASPI